MTSNACNRSPPVSLQTSCLHIIVYVRHMLCRVMSCNVYAYVSLYGHAILANQIIAFNLANQDVEERLCKTAGRYSEKPGYREPSRADARGPHAHITQRHEPNCIFYNTNICQPLSVFGLRAFLVLGPSRITKISPHSP